MSNLPSKRTHQSRIEKISILLDHLFGVLMDSQSRIDIADYVLREIYKLVPNAYPLLTKRLELWVLLGQKGYTKATGQMSVLGTQIKKESDTIAHMSDCVVNEVLRVYLIECLRDNENIPKEMQASILNKSPALIVNKTLFDDSEVCAAIELKYPGIFNALTIFESLHEAKYLVRSSMSEWIAQIENFGEIDDPDCNLPAYL
jgi:hypothetical protein